MTGCQAGSEVNLGNSSRRTFPKAVRLAIVTATLGGVAALVRWWSGAWPWSWFSLLSGVPPETLRLVAFALLVFLNLYALWAPRRRLPIRVAAVEQAGMAALVSVTNLGESAVFYARLEVLGGPRIAPLLPTWGPIANSNRIRLDREQPGILFLARAVLKEWAGPPFAASLEDVSSHSEHRLGWKEQLRVPVRLTITREEEKGSLPPLFFLRPRRSFVSDFVIKGDKDEDGRLSVERVPAVRRRG
jgi:hypothetical protein